MIKLKIPGLKSWFDPRSSQALKAQLVKRIDGRMGNKRGLFITLTYKRDNYANSRDLFRKQSERQDVPLFMRRLSRFLKTPLTGLWLRKMEFQEGGWVHFHIVLDYRFFVSQAELTRLWGHGHVWVNRWKGGHSFYIAKYMSKAGDFPDWLLFEKPRSIKIVSVSSGFWRDTEKKEKKNYRPSFYKGLGAYQPIYFRLQKYNNSTLVQFSEKIYKMYNIHISTILFALRFLGLGLNSVDGELVIECTRDEFERAVAVAGELCDACAGRPPLNLINSRNPDVSPPWDELFLSLPDEFGIVESISRVA